jgi:hypothetical protein
MKISKSFTVKKKVNLFLLQNKKKRENLLTQDLVANQHLFPNGKKIRKSFLYKFISY